MARPKRIGLDYFSFDVDFFEDEKVLPVSVEFGAKGEIIIVRLLCAIYREGYFVRWSEGMKFKIANQAKVSEHLVNDVVLKLVKYHFFNEELFKEFQILSSRGIQKRWNEATRKRVDLNEKEFWLLDEYEVSGGRNQVSGGRKAEESTKNDTETLQSILNETKLKEKNITPNGVCENPLDLSPENSQNEKLNYQEIINLYHSTCISFPKVQKLTDPRKVKIKTRIKELQKQFPELNYKDVLTKLFQNMEDSDFLRGNNKSGWKATFDWIFENGKNWVKVYEGNYANRGSKSNPGKYSVDALNQRKESLAKLFK